MAKPVICVRTRDEADELALKARQSADHLRQWICTSAGDGLELLRALKFDQVGFHPVEGRALNAIEQINQTWTYLVALAAVRKLLELHPDVGGFRIAPGAHAALPLDVMSYAPGVVGAETFAAVDPRNNGKLAKDLTKLTDRPESHRYVFFCSPGYPGTKRWENLERGEVQVWSVDV